MLKHIKELLSAHAAWAEVEELPQQQELHHSLVARQPVITVDAQVWGYELLYRKPRTVSHTATITGAIATSSVIINGFDMVRPTLADGQRLLINFTSELLAAQVLKLLPPQICIAEILENVTPTESVLDAVQSLKKAGYMLALDDYAGQEHLRPFLPLVDIVKVDVLGLSQEHIAAHITQLTGYQGQLLAEKVEDRETALFCRELGFTLFQGFFFSKPELIKGNKLSPSQAVRMRILAMCTSDNVDMAAISEAVLHDPIITARFLRFMNSAYFGLPEKVKTIRHALNLVGRTTFMQWICVNVLAAMETGPLSREIVFLASHRAKFLEALGNLLLQRRLLSPELKAHNLFLMGLFSLFESLLGAPLSELLQGIPLDDEVVAALSGGTSPYSPWLQLMNHYERGEWECCKPLAKNLCLGDGDLADAYSQAVSWNVNFFGSNSQ